MKQLKLSAHQIAENSSSSRPEGGSRELLVIFARLNFLFLETAASRLPEQLLQHSRGRCSTTFHSIIMLMRTLSFSFSPQAVLEKVELLLILQPSMRGHPSSAWAASSFLSSLLHIYPSSCFLSPRSFRFLFPAVLLFGLTLQLYNFKLFFCVLAEKSLIHLCCWSLRCLKQRFHLCLCFCFLCLSVWKPPGETESNQQNQNYPQNLQICVQPTCSDPNGELSSDGGDTFLKPSRLARWGCMKKGGVSPLAVEALETSAQKLRLILNGIT